MFSLMIFSPMGRCNINACRRLISSMILQISCVEHVAAADAHTDNTTSHFCECDLSCYPYSNICYIIIVLTSNVIQSSHHIVQPTNSCKIYNNFTH